VKFIIVLVRGIMGRGPEIFVRGIMGRGPEIVFVRGIMGRGPENELKELEWKERKIVSYTDKIRNYAAKGRHKDVATFSHVFLSQALYFLVLLRMVRSFCV
jgi:hypothetical protein